MYAVDNNDDITSREEYTDIADVTAPAINQVHVYNPTTGHLKFDVDVSDGSVESVVAIFDTNTELDSYWIELTHGVGSITLTDLDPMRTYIVEQYFRDSSWSSRYDNRERVPNGAGS